MRLIDADTLLQEIEESANAIEIQIHLVKCNDNVAKGMLSGLALVRENILRKPTAYNVDAVVEQIEEMFGVDPMYYGAEVRWAVDKAIEIVKAGGKV